MLLIGETIVAKKKSDKTFKVNKAYFKRFKDSFLYWQKEFGLMEYNVYFDLKDTGHNYAEIETDVMNKTANVALNSKLCKCMTNPDEGPESHAKHEVCHLLIARLEWIGKCRYAQESELDEENEAIVVRLARVLK